MNKKRLILLDVLVFILLVGSYLSTTLSWFLFSKSAIQKQTHFLSEQISTSIVSNETTMAQETARYQGLSDYQFSYFSSEGGDPIEDSTGNTSPLTKDDLIHNVNDTYYAKNQTNNREYCYCICFVSSKNMFFRVGIRVPDNVFIAKRFLIWGSAGIVAIYGVYFFFSICSFSKSLNSIKKQVARLRSVCGTSEELKFEDSMEFYATILRDSRKRLEKELTEAKEKAKETDFILSSFTEGIILFSSEKKVRILNKKAADIFELDVKEAVGRPLIALNKSVIAQKKVTTVMGTCIRDTYFDSIGSRVYQCEIEPLEEDKNLGKIGAAMLLIDVTEEFNSSKMKRDFFANASHELKSPLASILGYQEMIEQGILTNKDEIDDAIHSTIREARRMNKIIVDMLELSSLENETLRPIVQLEVGDALEAIIDSEKITANEKNVRIHFKKERLQIKVNEEDFDKLFRNLIENAIRYNKNDGDVYVIMDGMNISIKDTGVGIEKINISRIFERFYRVDKARSRKDGGTGLGLSIVKYICEYYGYKISVQSKINEGSTFTVTLRDNIVKNDNVE